MGISIAGGVEQIVAWSCAEIEANGATVQTGPGAYLKAGVPGVYQFSATLPFQSDGIGGPYWTYAYARPLPSDGSWITAYTASSAHTQDAIDTLVLTGICVLEPEGRLVVSVLTEWPNGVAIADSAHAEMFWIGPTTPWTHCTGGGGGG